MIFTPKLIDQLPDIFLNNTKLEWIKTIKYLGVIIDNQLTFIPECNSIIRRLSSIQGAIYSMSNFMPRLTLLTVYNSLVYSLFTYSIIFWGGIARTHVNSVQVIQNKILRIILNVQYTNNHIPLTL